MNTSADNAKFLQIQSVVKDFDGYKAVNNVSLDIAQGEIFALLGSSGCGKTTLLRMLAGFETPTSGRIVLNGQDLAGIPPYDRPLNMMFQSYALFPHLTVWDNIAFGLRRDKLPKDQVAARVEAMLKLVQLGKFGKRKPHQLSGGQQPSRAAWPSSRNCCCSTNRWAHWTRSCVKRRRSSWSTSSRRWASPA
jgi:putrescine transport system ATP-binding protein